MKCEQCYHGKVCRGSGIEIVADECHHFVEATKMVELPCKVGDTVCKICYMCGIYRIVKGKISSVYMEQRGVEFYFSEDTRVHNTWLTSDAFGATVFLTPEAAQKALEEDSNEQR